MGEYRGHAGHDVRNRDPQIGPQGPGLRAQALGQVLTDLIARQDVVPRLAQPGAAGLPEEVDEGGGDVDLGIVHGGFRERVQGALRHTEAAEATLILPPNPRSPVDTAFFIPDAHQPGRYHPTGSTVGPWSAAHQHGGPPIALLGHALSTHPGDPSLELARLTVEILGPIPLETCDVSVQVLRPGKRIELLQAQYCVKGVPVLTAQAWRLQRVAAICPAVSDPWTVPAVPEERPTPFFPGVASFPYGRALDWRFVQGSFAQTGPATVWARLRIPLIEGRPTSGLEGLLTLLDSANGVSCELDFRHWTFVPVDLTLNLHRQPRGPWFGMEARTQIDAGGIGLTQTTPFDADGAVGHSQHTLFVRPR